MKRSILIATCSVLLCAPAAALTQEEFDTAVARGEKSKTIKQAPWFLLAGQAQPHGAFGRTFMFGVSEPNYVFLIRGCHQFVAASVFAAGVDNKQPDFALLKQECIDRDVFRVMVTVGDAANELVMGGTYRIMQAPPVTAIAVMVDGKRLDQLEDHSPQAGSTTALYPSEPFRSAKTVEIVASIASQYRLTQRVPKRIVKQLFNPKAIEEESSDPRFPRPGTVLQ
jgi:hypothetical protein